MSKFGIVMLICATLALPKANAFGGGVFQTASGAPRKTDEILAGSTLKPNKAANPVWFELAGLLSLGMIRLLPRGGTRRKPTK